MPDLGSMINLVQDMTQANNEWSALQAQKQMDFQTRMSNTAHQREVADLKAAGLNPILSAHGNGASTPSGASGSTDNSNVQSVVSLLTNFGEAIAESAARGAGYGAGHGGSPRSGSGSDSGDEWHEFNKDTDLGNKNDYVYVDSNGDVHRVTKGTLREVGLPESIIDPTETTAYKKANKSFKAVASKLGFGGNLSDYAFNGVRAIVSYFKNGKKKK